MAVVTRYFSTSSAGAGDGTTWADRAALFDGSNTWAAIIDDFDFAGSDSLLCYIGPGTYTCEESLSSSIVEPTAENPLILHGCDSSGNPLTPVDPDWISAQPAWDDSGLPVINTTTNIMAINHSACSLAHLKITNSARTGAVTTASLANWCVFINSTENTASAGVSLTQMNNCLISCTALAYARIVVGGTVAYNCRIVGNASATSGTRYGSGVSSPVLIGCTILNNPGGGVYNNSASTGTTTRLTNCTLNNNAPNVLGHSTASQTVIGVIDRCYISNSGGWGIDAGAERLVIRGTRLRDNTSGSITNTGNYPTDFDNFTDDSDDATEFVDAANGDYRIRYGSAYWGKGIGAGDGPATIVG